MTNHSTVIRKEKAKLARVNSRKNKSKLNSSSKILNKKDG